MKKLYNFFACMGAVKKWGFTHFETITGKAMTADELLKKPPIARPTEAKFYPKRNGEIVTGSGVVIVKAVKEEGNEKTGND